MTEQRLPLPSYVERTDVRHMSACDKGCEQGAALSEDERRRLAQNQSEPFANERNADDRAAEPGRDVEPREADIHAGMEGEAGGTAPATGLEAAPEPAGEMGRARAGLTTAEMDAIADARAGAADPLRQAVEALDSLVAAIYEVLADPDCEDRVRPGLILARLMADVRAAELRRVLDDNAPEAGDSNASS